MTEFNAPKAGDASVVRPGLSRASFMHPNWFPPTAWVQHAPFAYFITEALRPKTYVELGSHYGYSFFAVCQAVKAYGLDTKCFAIDTWQGDEHAGFYSDEVYRQFKSQLDPNYAGFASMKRMTFATAARDFADGSIDLLHIDGRHFYEDAKEDFETYADKVAKAGVVMIHDTQVRERGFGVHQLWAEIAARYPAFEFHHGHGLGVAAIGAEVPAALAGLFALAKDAAATADLRTVYERLGESLEGAAKEGRQAFKTDWQSRAKRKARGLLADVGLTAKPRRTS